MLYSGANSSAGLKMIEKALPTFKGKVRCVVCQLDIIQAWLNTQVLCFGANDSTFDPERHLPCKTFRQNLQLMCGKILKETGNVVIIAPFPLPVKEEIKNGMELRRRDDTWFYHSCPNDIAVQTSKVAIRVCDPFPDDEISADEVQNYLEDCKSPPKL
jgi:hypothetical protein